MCVCCTKEVDLVKGGLLANIGTCSLKAILPFFQRTSWRFSFAFVFFFWTYGLLPGMY